MLDIAREQIVSLSQASALLPARRGGKRPHVATIYRWSVRGCRGVKLETCQVGGTKCTSREALQRFVDRLSGVPDSYAAPADAITERRLKAELDSEGL